MEVLGITYSLPKVIGDRLPTALSDVTGAAFRCLVRWNEFMVGLSALHAAKVFLDKGKVEEKNGNRQRAAVRLIEAVAWGALGLSIMADAGTGYTTNRLFRPVKMLKPDTDGLSPVLRGPSEEPRLQALLRGYKRRRPHKTS